MRHVAFSIACFLVLGFQQLGFGHAPWLVVNEDQKLVLFFGESLAERNYKLPPAVEQAEVNAAIAGKVSKVQFNKVESDGFVGLVSKSDAKPGVFGSEIVYGLYHGNRLCYHVKCYHGPLSQAEVQGIGEGDLQGDLIAFGSGIELAVKWDGRSLGKTPVRLLDAHGDELASSITNEKGVVRFDESVLRSGLHAISFSYTDESAGTHGDQPYDSTMHLCAITFTANKAQESKSTEFADLPFEITSFGAARVGDTAYVYGGHNGNAHSYSTEEQSNQLLALNLKDSGAGWKEVAKGERLQGLAMVPYQSSVIIAGGFTARNKRGDDHDLHSSPRVTKFDIKQGKWIDLPKLPAGRSSHDAAILGDVIYVVGGWTMAGEKETVWHDTAVKLDLSEEKPEWKEIAKPPFQRRALAVVAHDGKIFAIGGMAQSGGPTKEVSVYDPKADKWTKGPAITGEGRMAGFGAAAWSVGGHLVVSTYEGDVLQLSDDATEWKQLEKTEDARFFHRLIPLTENQLISVGGANMEAGKFLNVETLTID